MRYDRFTRLLHLLMAAGVTFQMVLTLVMHYPRPGRPGNVFFEMHETLGMALLGVLAVHWLWMLWGAYAGDPGMLFPYFSKARRQALLQDVVEHVQSLARFKLPEDDGPRPFPAVIQGLGLLCATALAATGTVIALGMGEDGAMSATVHLVKEVHESLGPLMWAYLIVHPLMALVHHVTGHDTLKGMFGFGR